MKDITASKVFKAAKALLERLDNITTDQFSIGGEKTEREKLRRAITAAEKGKAVK
jgi:hypothetical protein